MSRSDAHGALQSLTDARRLIDAAITPIADRERVPLIDALDRVLVADLVSTVAVPAHDNSAMDGYALRSSMVAPRTLRIVGQASAGHPFTGSVGLDDCVRIMTGAVMPTDCDAVVAQETVVVDDGIVTVDAIVKAGQHRRGAGEDLQVGATALSRGRRITPADLGLAASIGVGTLEVVRRPRVAVFSTGSELRDVDEALDTGSIRDANRYTIIGMLTKLGVDVVDLGIVKDDPAALEAAIVRACSDAVRADAIITSGGVSVGDADYTRDVMRRRGDVAFWSLAIKPGRPMAFGRVNGDGGRALLFALPGNPVAAMVIFYALVREALLKLGGASVEPLPSVFAISDTAFNKLGGRTEFFRGVLVRQQDDWHVRPTGAQGSGILRSMSEANGLIVLDHERGPVRPGERVEVWPFHALM
jgi:molybdopterin molybdotransferase